MDKTCDTCFWYADSLAPSSYCYEKDGEVGAGGVCEAWRDIRDRIDPGTGEELGPVNEAPLRADYQCGDDGEIV